MKLNNKGFAISSMIYSIFLLFLILVSSLLALLSYRKTILDAYKNAIYKEVQKLPVSSISKNVTLNNEERKNYDISKCVDICLNCKIERIDIDGYEIPSSRYKTYTMALTPGEYIFTYRIKKKVADGITIEKMCKITIEK